MATPTDAHEGCYLPAGLAAPAPPAPPPAPPPSAPPPSAPSPSAPPPSRAAAIRNTPTTSMYAQPSIPSAVAVIRTLVWSAFPDAVRLMARPSLLLRVRTSGREDFQAMVLPVTTEPFRSST